MNEEVEKLLKDLNKYNHHFIKITKNLVKDSQEMYQVDFYVIGIVNRSLSLLYGFETLIKSNNFNAAIHLVRLHLDSLLRLSAVWLVDDSESFVKEVMAGKPVAKLKDRKNKLLSDSYLAEQASGIFPWIRDVYKTTCGFIHYSNKHIYRGIRIDKVGRIISGKISKEDINIQDTSRKEAIECMIETSRCIILFIEKWLNFKKELKHSVRIRIRNNREDNFH